MSRVLQVSSSLVSLSKAPFASAFRSLVGATDGRSGTRFSEIHHCNVGNSTSRKSNFQFRIFCTGQDLSAKKCVPCDAMDLRPMTEQAAHELIPQVEGWNLMSEDGVMKLNRAWKVKSFTKGLELFKLVADVAEDEGHHPDLHLVEWNNVKIDIWTHAVGGLTENDFILAAKINALPLQQFLRKKVASKKAPTAIDTVY